MTPIEISPGVGGALQEVVKAQGVSGIGNVLVTIGIVAKAKRTSFENVPNFGSTEGPVSHEGRGDTVSPKPEGPLGA